MANITVKYLSNHYKTEYIKQLYRLFAIRSEDIPARLCQTNVLQNFRRDETDSRPADNVAVASSCIHKEPRSAMHTNRKKHGRRMVVDLPEAI